MYFDTRSGSPRYRARTIAKLGLRVVAPHRRFEGIRASIR